MNSPTHSSYAWTAGVLIDSLGLAPEAARFLRGTDRATFVRAAALPDQVCEVCCHVPGDGVVSELWGHPLAAFQHFLVDGKGYRWLDDVSLSAIGRVATAGAADVANLYVVEGERPLRPPLTGNLDDTPMHQAVAGQPDTEVGTFRFPSASQLAEYWARGACYWAVQQNVQGWQNCAGYVCHLVQDCLVPHHAWGCLLYGHQDWEDQLQRSWHETLTEVRDAGLIAAELLPAVRDDLGILASVGTVAALCSANAAFARNYLGPPHDLHDCPGDVALRVSVRAVAASIRAYQLMTTGGSSQ